MGSWIRNKGNFVKVELVLLSLLVICALTRHGGMCALIIGVGWLFAAVHFLSMGFKKGG